MSSATIGIALLPNEESPAHSCGTFERNLDCAENEGKASFGVVSFDSPTLQSLLKITALISRGTRVASITIRNLDDPLKARLRIRAAMHGRSMEDEARDILRTALNQEMVPPVNLAAAIRARFAPLGGVELPDISREPMREPPDFGG
jgi:plasmid stability protein